MITNTAFSCTSSPGCTSVGDIEEIYTHIIGYFGDIDAAGDYSDPTSAQFSNRQTLRACCLVNRSWHQAARKLLYHTVFASSEELYCADIAYILDEYNHLLDDVRVLRLSSQWLAKWWPMGWTAFSQIPNLDELELILWTHPTSAQCESLWHAIWHSAGLLQVKRLIVHGYSMRSIADLCSHLRHFPNIDDLIIRGCKVLSQIENPNTFVRHGTTQDQSHPCPPPFLRTFEWTLCGGDLTEKLNPMELLNDFNVTRLEKLSLEVGPTDWAPILRLCTQAKEYLRDVYIGFYWDWDYHHGDTGSNSVSPNLLELASAFPCTLFMFKLRGALVDISAWIQLVLGSDPSSLDLKRTGLFFVTDTLPPANLASLAESLQQLRKYVRVEFTFKTIETSEEELCAASPMLAQLLAERIVVLDLRYE